MSNLFYEQLERGYHGIPEGLIPLSVIYEIRKEIMSKDGLEDALEIIDEKLKEYTE